MKILIVSGFLGAGKTTFIRELIRRTGTAPVVLENEYGDNSIDAQELKQTEGNGIKAPEILEFMEGCVCCTMKDSFVNSVLTVYAGLSPGYLIVEPTGVGKLSNILANLQPIMKGDISLLRPVVVLSPGSFRRNMAEFPALYSDQIAHAQTVVFSKCENEMPELLQKTEEEIRGINPDAAVISRHYSAMEDSWWRSVMELPAEDPSVEEAEDEVSSFSQITVKHPRLQNPAQLILLLEDCLRGELGHVVRAKGTLHAGSHPLRFDLADGLYAISDSPDAQDQCVFIGEPLDRSKICERLGSSLTEESMNPGAAASVRRPGKENTPGKIRPR